MELEAERQLQRATAYWVEKRRAAAPSFPPSPSPSPVLAAVDPRPSEGPEVARLEVALEAMALRREIDVQKTGAFWIHRLSKQKTAVSGAVDEMESVEDENERVCLHTLLCN